MKNLSILIGSILGFIIAAFVSDKLTPSETHYIINLFNQSSGALTFYLILEASERMKR